jgi:Tol biopolymer transport system component
MTLAAGTRLGPYEILSPLGAGGMGEVYRARDTRLGREVAVKVLPASFSSDADRLRRFEQEARAASALNHPNIVTLHDIGTNEGAPYVVTELLEGETLRSRIAAGPLSPRKATEYAIQIAQGLAAAHEKSIVHRDLKPENLFVTEDGRVKILDFGLAKLIQPEASAAQQTSIPTASLGTEPGVVMGTAGYMSPEQVKGQAADQRSDIFSFGAILYEMLSGRRAFKGDSAVETMSAILKEDPPDLSETNKNFSPNLERLVRHCLEKSPAQRFQSARDLAYNLESLSNVSGPESGPSQALSPKPGRRGRFLRTAAALAVAASIVAAYLLGRRVSPAQTPVQVRKLSFMRGFPLSARFAPDGKTVVFAASRDGQPYELFLTRTDGTESRPVGVTNVNVLAVSRNGEVAVSLRKGSAAQFRMRSTLASVALLGGAPRPLLEDVIEADWSPDGKQLAVVKWAGGKEVLEFPIGRPVDESDSGIRNPRISPDGLRIAYVRRALGRSSLIVSDTAGQKTELARDLETKGSLAWHPSGREIWLDLDAQGRTDLGAISLDGSRRIVYSGIDWLFLQDISPDGSVLLSRWTSRSSIYFRGPGDKEERDLAWLDWGFSEGLSADGSLLMFQEHGAGGGTRGSIWVRRTEGSPAVKLTDGKALALSPDGKSVAALLDDKLFIYPTGAGQAREVQTGDVKPEYAAFFPGGGRIRVSGAQPGHERRNWILELETGKIRPLTPEGPQQHPVISPDGHSIAIAFLKEKKIYIYPVAESGERREVLGATESDHPLAWSADGKALYVYQPEEIAPKHIDRIEIATGRRERWKEIMPADPVGVFDLTGLLMTPDAGSYAYTTLRAVSGDLFVIEGLK